MKKSIKETDNHASIPAIQTRFERLVGTPRLLLSKAIMTIQEVQDALNSLLRNDANMKNPDNKLEEKVKKLKPLTEKKSKK